MNDHIYCKDPVSGIIYRCVGLSGDEKVILYPKYIPSLHGDRGTGTIKYKGIHYPTGSIKFLASSNLWQTKNVKLAFNSQFNSFLPIASKKDVIVYSSKAHFKDKMMFDKSTLKNENLFSKVFDLIGEIISVEDKISMDDFGIDASMLVGMNKESSDMDVIMFSMDKAKILKNAVDILIAQAKIQGPVADPDFFIQRRLSYSPLMTSDEIIEWESRKISGLYKGVKFSFMPKDQSQVDTCTYHHTNQFAAIRFKLKKDIVVVDPGYVNLKDCALDMEIVWGPKDIEITKIISYLPSRMGIFLKKGDVIFSTGKLYKINGSNCFALTQMPWDDELNIYETRYVTKIELTRLDNMIPEIINLNFSESSYTL